MKTAYFILGMHRSGTSAVSGVLNVLGLGFGSDLMKADDNNPKGYYENNKIYVLNETILKESNSSWDDYNFNIEDIPKEKKEGYIQKAMTIISEEFHYVDKFAIKDPRICMLFPFWEEACENLGIDIKVILPYRNPAEVALSLKKRNNFSFEKSIILWSKHTLDAEYQSRKHDRIFTFFDDLIKNREETLKRLYEFLDVELDTAMKDEIGYFLDKNIKHNNIALNNFTKDSPQFLIDTVEILKNKNFNNEKLFDSIRSNFKYSLAIFQPEEITDKIEAQSQQIGNLSEKLELMEKVLDIASLDEEFYRINNPDLQGYEGSLSEHFFKYGKYEARKPNIYCNKYDLDVSELTSKDEIIYQKDLELNSLKKKQAELTIQQENLTSQNTALSEQKEQQAADLDNKAEVIAGLQAEQAELQAQHESKTQEIQELNTQIDSIVQDLVIVKESKAALEEDAQEKTTALTEQIQELNAQNTNLSEQKEQQAAELENKAAVITGLQSEQTELQAQHENKTQEIQELNTQIDSIVQDLVVVKESKAALEEVTQEKTIAFTEQIQQLTSQNTDLSEQKEQQAADLENKAAVITGLQVHNETCVEEIKALQRQSDDVIKDLLKIKESNRFSFRMKKVFKG